MKRSTLPLTASLAVNVALAAAWWFRPARSDDAGAARHPVHASTDPALIDSKRADAILAALASGDFGALAAAGVPAEVGNLLAAARAFARLSSLARAQDHPSDSSPTEYWRKIHPARPQPTAGQRVARLAAEREFEAAMHRAFGEDPFGGSEESRSAFLSTATRDRLRQIERDYDEMRRDISQDSNGVELASDREKLRLLESEKQRDLAAAMSPAEREQFEFRSSPTARHVIDQYGDVLGNEEEYRRLYALQKRFDDQYATPDYGMRSHTPEEDRARAEAEHQLNDQLREQLGARWGTFARSDDREYQSLTTIASRLGLATNTPDQVYQVRDAYAAQSVAIEQNAALTGAARRTQLADLAVRATAELGAKLGPEGADAYLRQAAWIQFLQSGNAFTTDARLLPAGLPRPNGNATAFPLPISRPIPPPKP